MTHIPKLIHISWKNKNIFENKSELVKNGLHNLVQMNPEWQYQLNTDNDVDDYLKNNLEKKEYAIIQNSNIIAKLDIWRLLKIYNEGGLYIDLDRLYNIPLDNIINDNIKCVLPTNMDHDFSNDFILSAPQNPIYLEAIQLNFQRRWQGITNIYFLGAQTYMHAVTKVLVGERIDTAPGAGIFKEIRSALSNIPFIKTYRETPPYDTIVFKKDKYFEMDHEKEKRTLYADFGMKHWTNEW